MVSRLNSVVGTLLFQLKYRLFWASERSISNILKKVWNFDFQNLFMQFTFTRKFQKAMFLRRFDPLFTTFWHNLVTEIHSSFPRSKTSFLKMRFLRLNFVILTPCNWLKYELFHMFERFLVLPKRSFQRKKQIGFPSQIALAQLFFSE